MLEADTLADTLADTIPQDTVELFAIERLARADGCQTPATEIWDEAQRWAQARSFVLPSRSMFGMRLAGFQFKKRKGGKRNTVSYLDVKLSSLR